MSECPLFQCVQLKCKSALKFNFSFCCSVVVVDHQCNEMWCIQTTKITHSNLYFKLCFYIFSELHGISQYIATCIVSQCIVNRDVCHIVKSLPTPSLIERCLQCVWQLRWFASFPSPHFSLPIFLSQVYLAFICPKNLVPVLAGFVRFFLVKSNLAFLLSVWLNINILPTRECLYNPTQHIVLHFKCKEIFKHVKSVQACNCISSLICPIFLHNFAIQLSV